jgi:hypothetical protein
MVSYFLRNNQKRIFFPEVLLRSEHIRVEGKKSCKKPQTAKTRNFLLSCSDCNSTFAQSPHTQKKASWLDSRQNYFFFFLLVQPFLVFYFFCLPLSLSLWPGMCCEVMWMRKIAEREGSEYVSFIVPNARYLRKSLHSPNEKVESMLLELLSFFPSQRKLFHSRQQTQPKYI